MNILFISHLSTNVSAGPNWSVPAKIKAQTNYDNVYWMNWGDVEMPHWKKSGVFHKSIEFEKVSIDNFPPPFNHPDVVAFEGFYSIQSARLSKELRQKKIPYFITPRGSLTIQALNNASKWKKKIAHWLWFDSFVKYAASIQFLTTQEYKDSISKCSHHFILPNGFSSPDTYKTDFFMEGIKVVFIGRLDTYHKGLDLLIDACLPIMDKLRAEHVTFDLYGPQRYDADKLRNEFVKYKIDDVFSLKGETFGKAKENVLLNADAFILTSRFEGHPMGLIEALAYGVPALVTKGSNMKNEIEAADAGWVCDTTSDDIQNALLQMIADKHLFEAKSNNARNLSLEYDWNKLAERLHQELVNLTERIKF